MSYTKRMLTFSLLATLSQAIPALKSDIVGEVTLYAPVNQSPKYFLQKYRDGMVFYASAQSNDEGVQLMQYNSATESNAETSFDFIPVDSPFMEYSNKGCLSGQPDSLCYGHLRVSGTADDSGLGLVVSVDDPGRAVTQIPYLDRETQSDDSGQLLQFFSLKPSTGDLAFLGISLNPNATYSSEYAGPYGAQGYQASKGFVEIANEKDAEGVFAFDDLD